MQWPSNGEADVSFDQLLLTLRSALDLTQTELAGRLGISRRAIGEWESGNSAPKAEHLKQFIELAVKQQVFPAGQEALQIRRLWKKARQKVLLDEAWLQTLLAETNHQEALALPFPGGAVSTETPTPQATTPPVAGPQVNWGEALAIPTFYGREQEIETLSRWMMQDHCRVVSVLGMGGIGKSALAVRTMSELAEQFEMVLFRSLRDAPSCEALLDGCLQVLSPQSLGPTPATLEQRITLLLEQLGQRRTLVVLDNLESVLDEANLAGRFRPSFEGYERLLLRLAQTAHQSCLLLTSREKAAGLRPLESRHSPVRSLRLSGLDVHVGELLLAEKDLTGTAEEKASLIKLYAGNPLALRIVSEIIADLFGGQLEPFLAEGTVVFGTMTDLLDEHWVRLSRLEQSLLFWLAIVREPVTLEELQKVQVTSPLPEALEALDSLQRRSLIERGQRSGSFTLQSVVLEYVTTVLIAAVTEEIEQGQLNLLIQYGLELAQSKENIRQAQERLLLRPILAHLQSTAQRQDEVETLLLTRLEQVRQREESFQGYGPANLVALLRLSRGHLRGLDLSQLVLRGASLQGVQMQDAKLCGATLHNTTFTEAMPAIWSVAISRTGTFWAAGGWRGDVRIWYAGGRRLHLVWQAHTDNIFSLAFSPDERTLVTASKDGTLKLWDLQSGGLLWTARHPNPIYSVAFAPDGQMLASGGWDATIRFWEASSGKQRQVLVSPDSAVLVLTWSPDGQRLATGCMDSSLWLWQVGPNGPHSASDAREPRKLVGHSHWVHGLAFAPDGMQLASGSWDGTVKLWDVASGQVLHTLTGHTERVYNVAWSPDGETIASAGSDKRICLWDVAQQRYRAVLQGHGAIVYGLAFTPDSLNLLSGSEDLTIRVWEVNSGQCVRILQGYAISVYSLDWNPDSTHLISGSTDGLVLLWKVTGDGIGKIQPRVLGTHEWMVYGVAWSPDGCLLASSGWDNAIRVWDPTTGNCLHLLRDPDYTHLLFLRVAWSPDGSLLACSCFQHGIYVWNANERRFQMIERTKPMLPDHIAWSPDSTQLLCGGIDGSVYLWDMRNKEDIAASTMLQMLPGYQKEVMSVAWSPDGRLLASASGSEFLVREVHSGECLQTFKVQCDLVSAVAWHQSGDILVSGDSDGMLRWWEVQSGKCLRLLQGHEGTIWSLKRSPDGRWLASGGDDGAIRIWDMHSGEFVQTLRRDRPYERLNITDIRGLTEAQKVTLRALGAVEDAPCGPSTDHVKEEDRQRKSYSAQ